MRKFLTVSILKKSERRNVMSEKASDFEERLNSHPILKERFGLLLDIIEDTCGNYDKADNAELKFIEELRKTGKELMNAWASRQENIRSEAIHNRGETICHGKKNFSGIRHSEK
jgi:hypothetical protein